MNQLQFLVASTECARSDVRRYLRQLRTLDDALAFHVDCLRYITEQRMQYLSIRPLTLEEEAIQRAPRRVGRPPLNAIETIADAMSRSSASTVRRGLLPASSSPLTDLSQEALREAFDYHRTRVLRHAQEREAVAAELMERGKELRDASAARIAQFGLRDDVDTAR